MNKQTELDLLAAYRAVGHALAEIVFCNTHIEQTGPHRIEQAIKTYSEVCLVRDKIFASIMK